MTFNRINHFEIHATDPEKVIAFYKELFGWRIERWGGDAMEYWMIFTGEKAEESAINGGLMRRKGPAPEDTCAVAAYVCTVTVENLDAMMEKATKLGGKVALPKQALPGMAWLGYCKDNDGNIFGMIQNDPTAK